MYFLLDNSSICGERLKNMMIHGDIGGSCIHESDSELLCFCQPFDLTNQTLNFQIVSDRPIRQQLMSSTDNLKLPFKNDFMYSLDQLRLQSKSLIAHHPVPSDTTRQSRVPHLVDSLM
jgi:hypothetical protein